MSIDGGASWARLKANLPTVAFHDLTIHPRENDLVMGTYGRAVWVGDITPLQDLTPETLEKNAHLFDVEPRARYGFSAIGNYFLRGHSYLDAPNEPDAIVINYYVKSDVESGARVTVAEPGGRVLTTLTGQARRGLNRVQWSLGGGGGRGGWRRRTRGRRRRRTGRTPTGRRLHRHARSGHGEGDESRANTRAHTLTVRKAGRPVEQPVSSRRRLSD